MALQYMMYFLIPCPITTVIAGPAVLGQSEGITFSNRGHTVHQIERRLKREDGKV
jgi:hypothetical protein